MNKFIEIPASKHSIVMRKPLYGVGDNDADYMVKPEIDGKLVHCQFYRKWSNMFQRCYSGKYQARQPTYIGCTVTKEWLSFSNFKSWMEKQDWQGKELDKDLLVQGNKLYSPTTCLFVTREINSLLNDHKANRGLYPIGVSFKKQNNKFRAHISINGKLKYLGPFNTPELAHEEYKKAKYDLIKQVALQQIEPLRTALLNYSIG